MESLSPTLLLSDSPEETPPDETANVLSQQRFQTAFEFSPIGIAFVGLNGRWLQVNSALCTLLGYSPQELLQTDFQTVTHPDDLRLDLESVERLLRGEVVSYSMEKRYLKRGGETVWAVLSVSLVRDEAGQPLHFVSQVQDISALRQMEANRNASPRRAFTIPEYISSAFFSLDREWRFTYITPQAEVLLRTRSSEALGRTLWDACPEMLGTAFEKQYRRAIESGHPVEFEADQPAANLFFEVHAYPSEAGLSVYIQDISARKRSEDALRESEARYAQTVANVPGMVYRFRRAPDGALSFPFVSQSCRTIYGLEPEEVMRDATVALHAALPESQAALMESIEVSARDMSLWQFDGPTRHHDGRIIWLRGQARPRALSDGGVEWDGLLWDVSEQKAIEAALQEAKEHAEAAQRKAERANFAKSEFLSRMSHELRTPLNAILGFGQLLQMVDLDEQAQLQVGYIVKAGRHLLDLINEVLDIARIESGQLALSPEAVDLSELTGELFDLIRPLSDERGLSLDATLGSAPLYVRADRQRLKQVLLNLLSNAVKFNREGGSISVKCTRSTEGNQDTKRVRIEVHDTGSGIAPDALNLLFTPFERLDAEKRGIEGNGIGLALSKRLTLAMDGTIEVHSTLGHGSMFAIELPLASHPSHQLPTATETLSLLPGQTTISTRWIVLYIEDNMPNLHLMQAIWAQRPEIRLLAAKDGPTGLQLARTHCPDIILLDLHLPGMSGETVLKRLQSEADTAAIPVVVVSADATPRQKERLTALGARHYFTKPFDIAQFRQTIDELLEEMAKQPRLS